jgi:hypothetical protein
MTRSALHVFWIIPPSPHGPLGIGVTAWTLDDALHIIRGWGFGYFLPADLSTLTVREGVTVSELDQNHVVPNMGPIVVRGMWYPFLAVGVPKWFDAYPEFPDNSEGRCATRS